MTRITREQLFNAAGIDPDKKTRELSRHEQVELAKICYNYDPDDFNFSMDFRHVRPPSDESLTESATDANSMEQITVRIAEDTLEELDRIAEESNRSRAEVIRDVLNSREDSSEVDRLRDELDRARQRAERLERANLLILEDRERTKELEVYVDEQRRRKEAGKLKAWWNDLTGWD